MRLEQTRCVCVELAGARPDQLAAFLSRPLRPLRGLLAAERLQESGADRFTYLSRPYGVAGWTLRPRVLLRAVWDGEALLIEQLESRVEGLGPWQERLQFGLEARLRPVDLAAPAALQAEARVWAELPAAAVAVAGPVLQLGLQQLLDRLERRCQRGLRRRAEAWLAKDTVAAA